MDNNDYKVNIYIPTKALSFNTYQRNSAINRRYTTQKGVAYKSLCIDFLQYKKQELLQLKSYVEASSLQLSFALQINYYYKRLYLKTHYNSKCPDVDNGNKALIDILFGFMGLDDSHLSQMSCKRMEAANDGIGLTLYVVRNRQKINHE